jgi:hypothetical protein
MDISGETMFDIRISSRHEPSSPQLYIVVIQIEVKDEDFKQKLIRLGETKNIRLKCENNGILRNAFGLNDLDVDIIRDDERSNQSGYLDELIEKGAVFKFEIQDDAMVFMKKAKKVLSKYLESRFDLYRSQMNSGGAPLPQINVRKNLLILFGVVTGVIVILILTRLLDSGDNYEAYSSSAKKQIASINDLVRAENFVYQVLSADIVSEIQEKSSENQFVVVHIKIINDDKTPRAISTSLFKLIDSNGREYKADPFIWEEDALSYESINPGLSISGKVYFETPKGLTGFTLEADSGVLLAGGEPVKIDLGI